MIRCPNCNAENQAHFKFCLVCGHELVSAETSHEAEVVTPQEKNEPENTATAPSPREANVSAVAQSEEGDVHSPEESEAAGADSKPEDELEKVNGEDELQTTAITAQKSARNPKTEKQAQPGSPKTSSPLKDRLAALRKGIRKKRELEKVSTVPAPQSNGAEPGEPLAVSTRSDKPVSGSSESAINLPDDVNSGSLASEGEKLPDAPGTPSTDDEIDDANAKLVSVFDEQPLDRQDTPNPDDADEATNSKAVGGLNVRPRAEQITQIRAEEHGTPSPVEEQDTPSPEDGHVDAGDGHVVERDEEADDLFAQPEPTDSIEAEPADGATAPIAGMVQQRRLSPQKSLEASPSKLLTRTGEKMLQAWETGHMASREMTADTAAPDAVPPVAENAVFDEADATPVLDDSIDEDESTMFLSSAQDDLSEAYGDEIGPNDGHAPDDVEPDIDWDSELKATGESNAIEEGAEGKESQQDAMVICHVCSASNPAYFKFCGVCGSAMLPQASGGSHETLMYASSPAIELVLIHPDGSEGEHIPLDKDEVVIGRESQFSVFSGDPYLSPRHATFRIQAGALSVKDLGSLNGTFVRIQREVEVHHGDRFRVGQQLLRFELADRTENIIHPPQDGTRILGSPDDHAWGRLVSVLGQRADGPAWSLRTPTIFLGRERGTIIFADDGFMSGSHCRIVQRQESCVLSDLGSTNGTYALVKERVDLDEGDHVLLGQQLFRITYARPS